jgi:hypothetical protein
MVNKCDTNSSSGAFADNFPIQDEVFTEEEMVHMGFYSDTMTLVKIVEDLFLNYFKTQKANEATEKILKEIDASTKELGAYLDKWKETAVMGYINGENLEDLEYKSIRILTRDIGKALKTHTNSRNLLL